MQNFVWFAVTFLYFAGAMTFNFALFKIPIRGNDKQIAILALILGATNYYLKVVVGSPTFFIAQLIVTVIMLTLMRGYPILYSFLVTAIGAVAFSVLDEISSLAAIHFKIFTLDQILHDMNTYAVICLINAVITFMLAWLFTRYGVGFSFVIKKYLLKYTPLKPITFIWITCLLVGLTFLQVIAAHAHFLGSCVLIASAIVLFGYIYYAYKHNQQVLKEREFK